MLEINLKLITREVCKLLFSVVKREFNSSHYSTVCCLLRGSWMWIDGISIKGLKCADVSGIRLPFCYSP